MISNECIEAACAELRSVNIEPLVRPSGKHVAVVWDHDGKERSYFTAKTPSDWRAPLNARSDIRKILRNDGLLADGEATPSNDGPRLFLRGGAFHCDSRDIASHFGKQHKNVLQSIDKAMDDLGDFARLNFQPSEFVDSTGRKLRCFNLTRDGFTIIAMGFTGSDAMAWKVKYMTAFNAMEAEIRNIASAPQIAPDVVARIERLEGDLNALTDLCLSQPQPEPGFIIIKAYKRRVRGGARA